MLGKSPMCILNSLRSKTEVVLEIVTVYQELLPIDGEEGPGTLR